MTLPLAFIVPKKKQNKKQKTKSISAKLQNNMILKTEKLGKKKAQVLLPETLSTHQVYPRLQVFYMLITIGDFPQFVYRMVLLFSRSGADKSTVRMPGISSKLGWPSTISARCPAGQVKETLFPSFPDQL